MSELNKKRLVVALLIVAICLLGYFALPRLLSFFGPFLLAWFFSWVAQPVADFLHKKLHFPKRLAGIITVLLVISVIGGIITALIIQIVQEVSVLAEHIPSYYQNISYYVENLFARIQGGYINLPENVIAMIENFSQQFTTLVGNTLSSWVEPISKSALEVASHLPSALVFVVMTVLSTYFLLNDKRQFKIWLRRNMSEKLFGHISGIKRELKGALGGYLKAQLILMCITFCEVSIGFSILGVRYALFFAVIIAIMDAIPILGTGTFLIPYAIIEFILGNWGMGIGLLILYGICLLVRQFLEPKIISHQIGIHPMITLISMYVGLRLFGFIGMILGPPIALIVRYLYLGGIFYPLLPLPPKKEEADEA